ncbi:MAG TPA: prephenate dehydratase domain-containing protein [Mycobacteriales bacterium]|nr:prephenate dehydratase domain-containing protein [Mycobacteriales bacterium]
MSDPSDTAPDPSLQRLRADLDEVDAELVEVIARRLRLVSEVADLKSGAAGSLRDAARERDVLDRAAAAARASGVSVHLVRRLFEELLHHSVTHQAARLAQGEGQLLRVSYQGVENAYSYLAAHQYVELAGAVGEFVGCRTFREAADLLTEGDVDLAVLPIENTTAGSINGVYDLLRAGSLSIVGEEVWKVDHCLAGPAEVSLESLTRVLSHPQALEQCSDFLATLVHCEAVAHVDTAAALAAVAVAGDPTVAAIGSTEAATALGLVVLQRGVSNQQENYTRFVVLATAPRPVDPRVPCKTSLILVTRHEQGALLRCLEVLAASGLSMTKLESRPRPSRPFEYMFFLDFEGSVDEPRVAAAVDELRMAALTVSVLGSYPSKTVIRS